ncbi:MAG: hypothetical protein ACI93N_001225, partial [Flavobacteriaceae bacterium]
LFIAETINPTLIKIKINLIILEKVFITPAANIFIIKKELLKTKQIIIVDYKIAPIVYKNII